MTTSKGASQYNKLNWEESDFPIVCETCFGDNPFMRMTKDRFGKECGVCSRPFTVFRWQSDKDGKFRSTEICQVCTRTKNVCQSCIMDLEYGLPVQVRDKFLNIQQNLPTAPVNLEYNQQLIERQIQLSQSLSTPYQDFAAPGKSTNNTIRMLAKLAHAEPYSRNKPNICTFFLKGECKRGEECPYRHERPSDPYDPVNEQHIKDRYYGVDDSIAQRIISRYEALPKLAVPEDRSVTTILVRGELLESLRTVEEARGFFYQFGELRTVSRQPRMGGDAGPARSAPGQETQPGKARPTGWVVQFSSRDTAEAAALQLFEWGQLGQPVEVSWVETSRSSRHGDSSAGLAMSLVPMTAAPMPPPPPAVIVGTATGKPKLLPPLPQPGGGARQTQAAQTGSISAMYPSQDPDRLGNKIH